MNQNAEDLYFAGLKKHRQQDYEGAIRDLRAALEEDPQMADAWEALGVLYEKTERFDEAIVAMNRLLEVNPDEIMAHTNLSRIYMKQGLKEKAEEEQSKARVLGWKQELAGKGQSDSDFAEAGSGAPTAAAVSLADFVAGGPAAAPPPPRPNPEELERRIEQFERLVAGNPDDVLSRMTLGRTYLEADRFEDSIRILEELLGLKEDYTAAFVVLGEACEKAGKLARALKTYQRGIAVAERRGDLLPRNQMTARLQALSGNPEAGPGE